MLVEAHLQEILRLSPPHEVASALDQVVTVVVCSGGGGIPTTYDDDRCLRGIEAVIDKDLASGLLARELDADLLVIATEVDGVYDGWGTPEQRRPEQVTPDELVELDLQAGSMGPKVRATSAFARATGSAVIGSLADIADLVEGTRGTTVAPAPVGVAT